MSEQKQLALALLDGIYYMLRAQRIDDLDLQIAHYNEARKTILEMKWGSGRGGEVTDWADEIAEQLLDFWNWQAEKGLARDMEKDIAAALRDARMADFRDIRGVKRSQEAGARGEAERVK